jgi:hypothetical protein
MKRINQLEYPMEGVAKIEAKRMSSYPVIRVMKCSARGRKALFKEVLP